MKTYLFACSYARPSILAVGLALWLPSHRLTAQQSKPTSGESADAVVVLSPFEVNVAKDTGFVAASSLAGGRLATALNDTPVVYSVLTKDFIEALQLTDLNALSEWAPNSYSVQDNGNSLATGISINTSSRGLGSSSPQRDFFPISYNFDTYNIDRLDLARGPNAVLFGSSNLGGTANSITKRAEMRRQFTTVQATLGSWERYRLTVDENLPVNDQLAFRINAVYNVQQSWRDYDYQRNKGVTLAETWRPLPHTEIRTEAEIGRKTQANVTTNFDDWISAWDGKTTVSGPVTAANPTAGLNWTGGSQYIVFTPSNGLNTITNYQNTAITQGGNVTAAYPAAGQIVVGPTADINGTPIIKQINTPANLYSNAVNGSAFRVPSRSFATGLDSPGYKLGNENFTVAITQQFGKHFFGEIAANFDQERTATDLAVSRGISQVFIDVNKNLPTGAPNPNFLQPYGQAPSYPLIRNDDKTNGRVSLAYISDDTRFGKFQFNFIGGASLDELSVSNYEYVLKINPNPDAWPTANPVLYRYYFYNDLYRPLPQPATWTYVNPAGTTTTVPGGPVRSYVNTSFNQNSQTIYDYGQISGSAKLFKDRLDLFGAFRDDHYLAKQQNIVAQYDNPAGWNGGTFNAKPAAPKDYNSLSYFLLDANGNPTGVALPATTRPRTAGVANPLYAKYRFQDDYSVPASSGNVETHSFGAVFHLTPIVSVFADFSESFVPPQNQFDIYDRPFIASPSRGEDYGLRFNLKHGAIVVTVDYYQGRQDDKPISNNGNQAFLSSIIAAHPYGDYTPGLQNERGLANVPIGYTDSAEALVHGFELEVTANLTPNWRLIFNAALPFAYQINPYSQTLAYMNANSSTLKQIVTDAGGTFVGNVASFNVASQDSSGATAVAAWNGLQANLASVVSGRQLLTRLTEGTANLYTDFAFREGMLRGLRVGGGGNFRGRQVIGYEGANTIANPASPTTAIDDPTVGPLNTVFQKAYATATATLNYTRHIGRKRTIAFDLKIDNLFNYSNPIYYNTTLRPPGGNLSTPARVATPDDFSWIIPRAYTGSVTLNF